MLKVLETFSGIGAQAKALEKLNIEHRIVATADWDINAIIAYDLIHNGKQDLKAYENASKEELVKKLGKYTLSPDGKSPYAEGCLSRVNIEILKCLLCAIERSHNLVSITDMTGEDIPNDLDLLTYSFPCQDLSIAGVWHGNMSGIDREAHNRSGMLWEVERILKEKVHSEQTLPTFLLMENVSNIMAPRHMGNFQEWQNYLESIGYYNRTYKLNAKNFGVPQTRVRVYMLSVFVGDNKYKIKKLDNYFKKHNLEDEQYVASLQYLSRITMADVVKTNYRTKKYREEANRSQLNDTPSRIRIVNANDKILEDGAYIDIIKTITTKQDRNPNSGVIEYENIAEGKLQWRYLTPRECFLAMGFEEKDFDILVDNNKQVAKNRWLFSDEKLIKMAGNSIVVNVLEAIFKQVTEIQELLSKSTKGKEKN